MIRELRRDFQCIETSSPHTPEENGVAEAMNKKMTSTAAALMFNRKMPAPFWESGC